MTSKFFAIHSLIHHSFFLHSGRILSIRPSYSKITNEYIYTYKTALIQCNIAINLSIYYGLYIHAAPFILACPEMVMFPCSIFYLQYQNYFIHGTTITIIIINKAINEVLNLRFASPSSFNPYAHPICLVKLFNSIKFTKYLMLMIDY